MPTLVSVLYSFLTGTVFALSAVVSLLFARFYKKTADRLFLWFSIAFGVLALSNLLMVFIAQRFGDAPEDARHPMLYSMRCIAFGIIFFAIIDKNRSPRKL
ncbi:MAG: DUF5985 family protein [Phycisphaerae bacterium]